MVAHSELLLALLAPIMDGHLLCMHDALIYSYVADGKQISLSLGYIAAPLVMMSGSGSVGRIVGTAAPGMVDTLVSVYQKEGVRGLYRGFLPNFLKAIPAVSIGYVVYERLKLILKVDTVR